MLRIVGDALNVSDIPELIRKALREHPGVNTLVISVSKPERANLVYHVYSDTRKLSGGQLVEPDRLALRPAHNFPIQGRGY